MVKVFAYGTLLKGMVRSEVLANGEFVGNALSKGTLYDLGPLPALVKGDRDVYGELYEVTLDKLRELDLIEGYHQDNPERSLYIREEISVTLISDGSVDKAYAYFFNGSVDPWRRIECGDYRRYLLEVSSEDQWYIAYGSNMSVERLNERIGAPRETRTGYLNGYELRFNKRSSGGGSYANIAYVGEGSGCPFAAYLISKEQLSKLDLFEGEPSHYIRIGIPFRTKSEASHLGHVYVANPERLTVAEDPSPDYLKHIYKGYKDHRF